MALKIHWLLNLLQHNDVAVLTVDPPIVYSGAISPVCLTPFNNAADQLVGKDAAIIGWGRLESGKHTVSFFAAAAACHQSIPPPINISIKMQPFLGGDYWILVNIFKNKFPQHIEMQRQF
jgi:hypothetical protein